MKSVLSKIICSLISFSCLVGCMSSNDKSSDFSERLDVNDSVDMWNSVQYEIISDAKVIQKVEPEAGAGSKLVHFRFRIENRGRETAESFRVTFQEPVPFAYSHGSMNQGIDRGRLKRKEEYEVSGYYVFDNMTGLDQFVADSGFRVQWTEEGIEKQQLLTFPVIHTIEAESMENRGVSRDEKH